MYCTLPKIDYEVWNNETKQITFTPFLLESKIGAGTMGTYCILPWYRWQIKVIGMILNAKLDYLHQFANLGWILLPLLLLKFLLYFNADNHSEMYIASLLFQMWVEYIAFLINERCPSLILQLQYCVCRKRKSIKVIKPWNLYRLCSGRQLQQYGWNGHRHN